VAVSVANTESVAIDVAMFARDALVSDLKVLKLEVKLTMSVEITSILPSNVFIYCDNW
jgi:hypothetical protein